MTYFILILIGVFAGAGLLSLVLLGILPKKMIQETKSAYSVEESEARLLEIAEKKGWKVPVVHDLRATMEKNNFTVMPVKVYEICKPSHAYEILSRDKEKIMSAMMPCRISIYEKSDGKVYISRLNSGLMAKVMEGIIPRVMKSATIEMEEIIEELKG